MRRTATTAAVRRATVRPNSTVGGPVHTPTQTCRWCRQTLRHVWINDRYDHYEAPDGSATCTPAQRGVTPGAPGHCVFGYYADEALMGPTRTDKKGKFVAGAFDPLTLSHHDLACSCRRSLPHLADAGASSAPYAYPDLLPWHCDQPMMLRIYAAAYAAEVGRDAGWHCRSSRCLTVLAPVPAPDTVTA